MMFTAMTDGVGEAELIVPALAGSRCYDCRFYPVATVLLTATAKSFQILQIMIVPCCNGGATFQSC
jgi:hypothetical protein